MNSQAIRDKKWQWTSEWNHPLSEQIGFPYLTTFWGFHQTTRSIGVFKAPKSSTFQGLDLVKPRGFRMTIKSLGFKFVPQKDRTTGRQLPQLLKQLLEHEIIGGTPVYNEGSFGTR